jgi:hypothetical protein
VLETRSPVGNSLAVTSVVTSWGRGMSTIAGRTTTPEEDRQ